MSLVQLRRISTAASSPIPDTHRKRFDEASAKDYPYPGFTGRGIVICAGGEKYLTCAWVCINVLRHVGCDLPIQVWYRGPGEMPDKWATVLRMLPGVELVDAFEVRKAHPVRILNGWELKPFAMLWCPFKEVLLLDADNVVTGNLEYLFDSPEYQRTGAIFWPDRGRYSSNHPIWEETGVPWRDEPEFETGQIVVNKEKCWKAMNLTMHMNEFSDHWYRIIHGDKDTFHMAWRKLDREYSMPVLFTDFHDETFWQKDFSGKVIFQHRNGAKWSRASNPRIKNFQREDFCLMAVEQLNMLLEKTVLQERPVDTSIKRYAYCLVGAGYRVLEFLPDGTIGEGAARLERRWSIDGKILTISGDDGVICQLQEEDTGCFRGRWEKHEQFNVLVIPI